MESNSSPDFWQEIAADTKCEIPEVIKFVLPKCGYNSRLSLCNVSIEDIVAIEKYATESFKHELKHLLKSLPEYNVMKITKEESFKFLPGHRRIIVQIGSNIAASGAHCTCPNSGQRKNEIARAGAT